MTASQLMSFEEVKDILKVQLETDEYPSFKEEDIIKNFIHYFQTQIPLKQLGLTQKLNQKQNDTDDMIQANPDTSRKEDYSINLVFAVKHFNNQKIDSHLYFFRGFC